MAETLDPINWQDDQSYCLLNPRWPETELRRLKALSQKYAKASHIWISSSGSSKSQNESVKLIALSKKAFLASASAVNNTLQSTSKDRWALALPSFHVGGLSLFARAHLSGAQVIEFPQIWEPQAFYHFLSSSKITLCSLVPTQLSDLVEKNLKSPASLRALIIGGAALSESLYRKAIDLGWPVLPSFGMTEACSQIATAALGSHKLKDSRLLPLDHIELKTSELGRLSIKSPSLLTGYAQYVDGQAKWINPVVDGWYHSTDFAIIEGDYLKLLGRGSDFVQIGGETVQLQSLREVLESLTSSQDVALVALEDDRLGHRIALAHTLVDKKNVQKLVQSFNERVLPYERIRDLFVVENIPRSELGKPQYQILLEMLKAGR